MITASELISATKASKYKDWIKPCELEQKRKSPPRPKELETALNAMYEALGNDRLSSKQWAERMGWKVDLVRHRAGILVRQKKVKRTTGLMPFRYFKV